MSLLVYYIDDESLLCELFTEEFSQNNIQVKAFIDPQKAINELKVNPPDVIFLDYRLPGTTGDKVALTMPKEIPKYLITGELHVKTVYPFKSIIQKPYGEEQIVDILEALIKNKS